jgi:hypothetical protein
MKQASDRRVNFFIGSVTFLLSKTGSIATVRGMRFQARGKPNEGGWKLKPNTERAIRRG